MQTPFHITELAGVDIRLVNKEELTDVSGTAFDTTVPEEQRGTQLLREVGNPYCFRVGDLGVKLEFPDNGPSLADCLTDFLLRKRGGL